MIHVVIFLISMALVLNNLLISHFSSIYGEISKKSRGIWAYLRFTTVWRYAKKEYATTNFERIIYKLVLDR